MAAAHHQAKHSFAPRTAAGTRIAAGGSLWSPPVLARRGVALARETAEHRKATASVRDKVRDKVKTQKHTSTGRIGRRLGVGQSQCANKDFKAERPESLRVGPKAAWGAEGTRGFQGSRLAAPVRCPRNFHLPGTSACVQFFHDAVCF